MNGSSYTQNQVERWRILAFVLVLVLTFGLYAGRLFWLQIVQGTVYTLQANDNRTATVNEPAPRGVIYDRNGTVLARNLASYNAVVTAADLPDDPGEIQEIYRNLSALLGVPVNGGELSEDNPFVPCISNHGIAEIVLYGDTSTPFTPVPIKCDIDRTTAMILEEKAQDWPGVGVEIQPIRDYPTGEITASIVGFLGPIPASQEAEYRALGLLPNRDKVGYAGLELQYQDLLAGQNGLRTVEVDVAGAELQTLGVIQEARPGLNLRLTLDTRLQQAATAIVEREINYWNNFLGEIQSTSGVAIAMNPTTGEVLAMVSYPSYENNRMARFIPAYYYTQLIEDPANPLLNHAVGDVLPAGSVFKLVTAVGALNEGVVTPDQVLETPPKITISERYFANDRGRPRGFVDWNKAGFGRLSFIDGLANSSNVYFYKLGGGYQDEVPEGLGVCRLGTYARALGYGDYPGIGMPEEEKGLIPDPRWKRITHGESWSTGDTYIASVGQGFVLATPLQVLMSAATIANNGKLMQPQIVREVLDSEGNVVKPFTPIMKWDITKDPVIQEYYDTTLRGCEPIEGQTKTVEPWVIQTVQAGMRRAVTNGTLTKIQEFYSGFNLTAAGKTGTAEYCDKYADARNRCIPGNWPSHAWTVGYAPYETPEIAVVAFVYNGNEGSSVAGPIVWQIMNAYFELKTIDNAGATP